MVIGRVKQHITQFFNMHNYLVGYYSHKIFNILYQHKIKNILLIISNELIQSLNINAIQGVNILRLLKVFFLCGYVAKMKMARHESCISHPKTQNHNGFFTPFETSFHLDFIQV